MANPYVLWSRWSRVGCEAFDASIGHKMSKVYRGTVILDEWGLLMANIIAKWDGYVQPVPHFDHMVQNPTGEQATYIPNTRPYRKS